MKIKLLDLQNIILRRGKIHFDTIYVNSKHIYFIFYYIYCLCVKHGVERNPPLTIVPSGEGVRKNPGDF